MRRAPRLAVLGLSPFLIGLGACASGLRASPYGEGPLRYEACPALPIDPGGECSLNRVPARWDQDQPGREPGHEIEILLRRFTTPDARAQLWMLDGGPGSTGAAFSTPAFRSITVQRGLDLYVPTHRGAGLSTPLSCPLQEAPDSDLGFLVSPAEADACARSLRDQWGDDLTGFSSYDAARDVAHLMRRARRAGVPVYVWGGSYGSFWAQRLLEVAPDAVDGVILEGTVPPDANFEDLSENADEGVRRLLSACGREQPCADHFGGADPEALARTQLQAALGGGSDGTGCGGVPGRTVQALLAHFLLNDPGLRPLVAPLVARLARCSAHDRAELAHAATALAPQLTPAAVPDPRGTLLDPLVRNLRLGTSIFALDLIRPQRSLDALARREDTLVATARTSLSLRREIAAWDVSAYRHRLAGPVPVPATLPMLLFAGGLDGQTPLSWSERTAAAYAGPAVQQVTFPQAGHMTYAYTGTTDGKNCTVEIMTQFLRDPRAPLDLSCTARVRPLDLAATSDETAARAETVFGTRAPWGRPY